MPIRQQVEHQGVEGARVGRFNRAINTTFVVYRIGDTLIDAGPSNQWKAVRTFVDLRPPKRLLLTHHHEDHAGNADRIARRFDLTPFAPELGRAKLASGYRTPLTQRLVWGSPRPVETQPLPDHMELGSDCTLRAIPTPGHAKDHTCLLWQQRGFLFSGDLYLARNLTHMRSDENLQLLMQSIVQVLRLDFDTIFCSHRGVVEQGHAALSEKLDNLKQLCEQARELHEQGLSESEIVVRLRGPEDGLSKMSRYNISKRNLVGQAAQVDISRL
ncbi:MAG: MBL fold metallo-hydrolase [Planctomycetaceae bacterium]|nr:MBL fold metallo-hydrolase [Planctomycetaceae bacterium]